MLLLILFLQCVLLSAQTVFSPSAEDLIQLPHILGHRIVVQSTDVLTDGDLAKTIEYTAAGAVSITGMNATRAGASWYALLRCGTPDGAVCVFTPAPGETVNGATTLVLSSGEWVRVSSDGTNWNAQRTFSLANETTPAKRSMGMATTILTNGDFATGDCSGWTCGPGWVVLGNTAHHRVGENASLSQSITLAAGTVYEVRLGQSGAREGTLTVKLGGVTSPAISATPTISTSTVDLVVAVSGAQTLAIIPSKTFDGTLSHILVEPAQAANPALPPSDSSEGKPEFNHPSAPLDAEASQAGRSAGVGVRAAATNYNTAFGQNALLSNTSGFSNSAFGFYTLNTNTTGPGNTAVGASALTSNVTGNDNTAVGKNVLYSSTGSYNTIIGSDAGHSMSTGTWNTGVGANAMSGVTTGSYNTVVGSNAGGALGASGSQNALFGLSAGGHLTSGSYNSALGSASLWYETSGMYNTAIGYYAGVTNITNAVTTATYSTFVGANAGQGSTTQHDHLTVIGAGASGDENNAVVLGRSADAVVVPGRLRIAMRTPNSASDACTKGEFTFDTVFVYWCIATNTWIRSQGTRW